MYTNKFHLTRESCTGLGFFFQRKFPVYSQCGERPILFRLSSELTCGIGPIPHCKPLFFFDDFDVIECFGDGFYFSP